MCANNRAFEYFSNLCNPQPGWLLTGLSKQYREARVDFEPVNPKTKDIDFDYDIFLNGQNFVGLADGLDTPMKAGDEIVIKMNWRWDG